MFANTCTLSRSMDVLIPLCPYKNVMFANLPNWKMTNGIPWFYYEYPQSLGMLITSWYCSGLMMTSKTYVRVKPPGPVNVTIWKTSLQMKLSYRSWDEEIILDCWVSPNPLTSVPIRETQGRFGRQEGGRQRKEEGRQWSHHPESQRMPTATKVWRDCKEFFLP